MKTETTLPDFTNDHGSFKIGDMISFRVENEISGCWNWDTNGQLRMRNGEWVIKTRQGVVTINKGYDAYSNSIRPERSIGDRYNPNTGEIE